MAAIIQALVFSGSRLSTGAANDTGTVYAYVPGTTTPATLYSDPDASTAITQPITLDSGGRIPYDTYPDGVWITTPVRLLVQDADGNTVSDAVAWTSDAGTTALVSENYTSDTVEGGLNAIATSVGGTDGNYLESGGATDRPIQDKFRELGISVKDFGAVGNGIAIDTTAIQDAINRVAALGGGTVLFPPGTYKIDQALSLSSVDGVTLSGAGPDATTISSTNTSANCLTVTSCDSFTVAGITLEHASTSTGTAISLDTCSRATLSDIVHEGGSSIGWRVVLSLTSSPLCTINNCTLTGESSNAAARGIALATGSSGLIMTGGNATAAAGYGVEVDGNTGSCVFVGVNIAVTFRYAATASGSPFTFVGSVITTISVAAATAPIIRLVASSPLAYQESAAAGGTVTPSLIAGQIVLLTASGGGPGTVNVANPSVLPVATIGQFWDFLLINSSGGDITWSFGANYKLNVAVTNSTAQTTTMRFYCDGVTIRETSRQTTPT